MTQFQEQKIQVGLYTYSKSMLVETDIIYDYSTDHIVKGRLLPSKLAGQPLLTMNTMIKPWHGNQGSARLVRASARPAYAGFYR